MKNWKRAAAFGMAAIMAAGMVTACGGGSSEEGTEAAADAGEAEDSASAEGGEAADTAEDTGASDGELKEVYVLIRDRGDLSYWDSMAEGGDRAVTDYADRANVHVIETTADIQANRSRRRRFGNCCRQRINRRRAA